MRLPLPARSLPPLVQLGGALAGDFVSTLVFALLFWLTHSLAWSLGVALASGLAGLAWRKAHGRKVDAMQGLSLALVVVLGGASLLTHDARFVMFKPTMIYLAVAAVMLKPGWMRRYLPAKAQRHGTGVTDAFGYAWSAAMAGLALVNLALALHGDVRLWAAVLATAPLGLKLALGVTQYAVTRHTVVLAIRKERADATAG